MTTVSLRNAARLATQRDLQRSATNVFSMMLLCTMLFATVIQAQQRSDFDFGSNANTPRSDCPVVVFFYNNTTYQVITELAGFVFDQNQEHNRELALQTFSNPTITKTTGFFHCKFKNNLPAGSYGDIEDVFPEVLGAGRYTFTLLQQQDTVSFTLDLTDGNWARGVDPFFRNILITPDFGNKQIAVQISVGSKTGGTQLIDCGTYGNDPIELKYWELVRYHGTASQYARVYSDFSIDPGYQDNSNDNAIPYGVSEAVLDVDVSVREDIVIPSGKILTITTDPDVINSPLVEQTEIMFNEGTGLVVEDGGTLITHYHGPFGVVDWFCYNKSEKGAWKGIVGTNNATMDLSNSLIFDAEEGIRLEGSITADLFSLIIGNSLNYGLHVLNASPLIRQCSIIGSGNPSGTIRGANVYVEGPASRPSFSGLSIRDAVKSEENGICYGGHGVLIVNSDSITFTDCIIARNDSCGLYIQQSVGPRIEYCFIYENGKNLSGAGGAGGAGVYVYESPLWTTLRYSRVYENPYGIYLNGSRPAFSRIRGWYHADQRVDPNDPDNIDKIRETEGRNCIYANGYNLYSEKYGRFDFGSLYYDTSTQQKALGHMNSIYDPVHYQIYLDNHSHGGVDSNWWNNNLSAIVLHNSTIQITSELAGDSAACFEFSKRAGDSSGSFTQDVLHYRRTRGRVQTEEEQAKPVGTVPVPPATFILNEPYPNPFTQSTDIAVTLLESQEVHLSITDLYGRLVAVLASGYYEMGRYTTVFHAGTLPSGMYTVVLRNNHGVQMRQLLLTK